MNRSNRTGILHRELTLTRTSAHLVAALLLWPSFTIIGTTLAVANLPYFSVSLSEAVGASVVATLLIAPDMLVAGAMFFGASRAIFGRLGASVGGAGADALRLLLEPLLMLTGVAVGVALWYPAILGSLILAPLGALSAASVVAVLLGAVVAGSIFVAKRHKRLQLAAALIGVGVASPLPLTMRSALEPHFGHPPEAIILGLDSVSYHDSYAPFAEWVQARGGVWYERAVTPGLLTNSVWASILTTHPVRQHGVFHTFQPLPDTPPAMLASARAEGYRTVSVFTDQLTCAVGSRAGFDEDRSSPVGWRQLLLPLAADNSLLVPIVKPALPRLWPSLSPPNHAGTFTYDLRREIRGILRAGARAQRTFVAAHINYPHHPAYPGVWDLSWPELWQLAKAPAARLRDRSFNWQDRDEPSDPVQLHPWKLRHLHEVLMAEIDAAHYVQNGGRLVVFSDHGDRAGLAVDNFADPRYYHVPLATFGVAPRCPEEPISLLDIGSLLGWSKTHAVPSVEFTIAPQEQWSRLVSTAGLQWSGDVNLDRTLLAALFKDLRRHDPWPDLERRGCLETESRR